MTEEWTTKKVDKYVLVNKKLGTGAYGVVYRGFLAENENENVAVKTIPIKVSMYPHNDMIQDSSKMLELIKREIGILQKVNHPNIVKLFNVARTSNYLYMFLEFCNDGDLKEYMMKKEEKRLSEMEALVFLNHIVEGFKKLHQLKIIHRDIKPANILLSNGVAKITDFGFARMIETEMNDPSYLSRLGSPLYMAPQILEGQPFSAKCDVWSVGVMFYELLYGRTPWNGENQYNLCENIKTQPLKFPPKPVRSQKVKDIIIQMLQLGEKERISWESIFIHPSLQKEDKIEKEQNKDDLSNSIDINRLYMENNLVIGYLTNISKDIDVKEKSQQDVNSPDSKSNLQAASQYENERDGNIIINNYKNEQKKRESLMKYYNYFLFERNISFFFNFVIQKIIKMKNGKFITLEEDVYFRLIYLISKNQIIHLIRIHKQLSNKDNDMFDKQTWGKFLASEEYKKVFQILNTDMKYLNEFFKKIANKTVKVTSAESANLTPFDHQFFQVLQSDFDTNELFRQVYRDQIASTQEIFLAIEKKTRDQMLAILYFNICLNPYEKFKDINFDFNQFYEDYENMTQNELQEKIQIFSN